ncbi:hypothetical protein K457DRAFT_28210 [Linnemannia elongata AG-77]|uniref:Uncharacterized protein n=1 Tax=Linnemannia elongata AG-77 TaxID=1314771 RepID=A0A197KEQ6_9FUNG|nr:hypothetical protein K457DRAFT_28210 [Linnemannia elongata AG-77]
MWLYHGPHLLHASIPAITKGPRKVTIDCYNLIESENNDGRATLQHQRQIAMTTLCSQEPRILCFQRLFSNDCAMMQPHVFIYDSELEQLECHRFDLDSQTTVVRIGVKLGHIVHCSIGSRTGILIASKSDRPSRPSGFDLFEWTPAEQKLLLGHIDAESIVGVSDSPPGRPWSMLFTHPDGLHGISAMQGSAIMNSTLSGDSSPQIHQINAIPTEYRNNLRMCYMQFGISGSLDNVGGCRRIWAHTRSDELVFIEDGTLQWSVPFAATAHKFVLGECQSTQSTSRLCLCVYTEAGSRLYEALSGALLQEWSQDVLLADVRQAGLDTAVSLPRHMRQKPLECNLYPAVGFLRPKTAMETTHESKARAKSNLNSALGTLEEQLALKQKKIERLQASLVGKGEILQGCQEVISDSLRFSLFSGLGPRMQEGSVLSQQRKNQRRKRLLERLVPIVGSTVATSFQSEFDDRGAEKVKIESLDILECTAGWVTTSSRDLIWLGVKVKNTSDQPLFHLRLSVAQQNSRGCFIPRLESQGTDVLLGVVEVDRKWLDDFELLDRSKAFVRILTDAVLLHYSPQEGQDNSESLNSSTLLIPRFTRQDTPPDAWRQSLDEVILPARAVCCLGDLSRSRITRLLQDGLGLSLSTEGHGEEEKKSRFGSVEEDMVARIVSAVGETERDDEGEGKGNTNWDVYFYAPTEVLATVASRKAALLSHRFQ